MSLANRNKFLGNCLFFFCTFTIKIIKGKFDFIVSKHTFTRSKSVIETLEKNASQNVSVTWSGVFHVSFILISLLFLVPPEMFSVQ